MALIYKSPLNVQRVFDIPMCESFEYLNLSVCYRPRRVRVLVVYRPPGSSTTVFMTEFQAVLEILSILPEEVIIVGDFNIHVDVPTDKLASEFINLVDMFGFSQRVKTPTHSKRKRVTNQGHILDLVLVRQSGGLVRDVTVGDFISDHCLVTCALSTCSPGWPTARILVRSLKSIDTDSFSGHSRPSAAFISS